jgi:hypothetical protein
VYIYFEPESLLSFSISACLLFRNLEHFQDDGEHNLFSLRLTVTTDALVGALKGTGMAFYEQHGGPCII